MKRWPLVVAGAMFLCLIVWSCSKNSAGGDDGGDDGDMPYFIGDLVIDSVTDSTIMLTWTATGDDADQGTASSYDIRYWHSAIMPSNWDSAHQIAGEPHPKPAGSKESLLVHNLKKDTTYYFSMIVCDEANNCTGSNGVWATCFSDKAVTFADPKLDSAIRDIFGITGPDIMLSDLRAHDGLAVYGAGIVSLEGMQQWTGLRSLGLAANQISDLAPLANLHNILYLDLTDNNITDISPLANVQNLFMLHLRTNQVSDLTALTYMTLMQKLDLTQNEITDLAPLVANTGLGAGDTIWVGENPLSSEATTVQIPALQAREITVLGL